MPTTAKQSGASRGKETFAQRLPHLLPALVIGFIVGGLTLFVWQALLRQQQRTIAEATQAASMQVAHELTARLEARIQALERMAARWERQGQPDQTDWAADVALYLQHYPGSQAIGWVDSTFTLRWVAPVAGNEAALGLPAAAEPRRRLALEKARDQRTVYTTHVLDLVQGGKGVAVYIPLFPRSAFDGVLSAVFRLQTLGTTLLSDIAPGYGVVLNDRDEELYRRLPPDAVSPGTIVHTTTMRLPGVTWQVQVWPGSTVLAQHQNLLPYALLVLGLILAGALSLTVFLVQTARQHAQETMAANQQLDTLNAVLEQRVRERTMALARAHADLRQVAYVSAHDMQEPVRQIGIYTQQIAKHYHDSLEEDLQEAVDFIVEGTKRMQAQFTDLMHYLEIEEPDDGITSTECETLLQNALDALREPIAASGATITHDPLPTITANAKHLQLVFQELIDNAVKFRASTPPQVHVWAERDGVGWRFAVRDNGIGIAPQNMLKLFGLFRRLQRRQDYPGTGMGLAMCKKIVDRHGGRIWIDSQAGEGTTVYFTMSGKVVSS